MNYLNYLLLLISMMISVFSAEAAQKNQWPWYFEANDVLKCWNQGFKGQHVVVQLLDSRVDEIGPLKRKIIKQLSHTNTVSHSEVEFLHGTAMASLISADRVNLPDEDNPAGSLVVAGIAPNSRILSLAWLPGGNLKEVLTSSAQEIIPTNHNGKPLYPSLEDATPLKISIVNISSGVRMHHISSSSAKREEYARDLANLINDKLLPKNALLIVAMGNDGKEITNNNKIIDGILPASLSRPGKISRRRDIFLRVAALNTYHDPLKVKKLYRNSNYGSDFTDIAAPGETNVLTPSGKAKVAVGTSNAAAIVSSAIALMVSCNPYAAADEVRSILLSEATPNSALEKKVAGGRILNIWKAVNKYCLEKTQPPKNAKNATKPSKKWQGHDEL